MAGRILGTGAAFAVLALVLGGSQAGAQGADQAGAQGAGQVGAQGAGQAGAQGAGQVGAQSAGQAGAQGAGQAGAQGGRLGQPRAAAEPARLTPADSVPHLATVAAAEGKPLFGEIMAGDLAWNLGESTLADVARAFGGQLDQGGAAGGEAAWLCFAGMAAGRPAIFWFVSDAAAGGPDQVLTGIAVEPQGPHGAGTCAPAPPNLAGIEAGLPGPGAKLAELRKALGEATPGPAGHVHYAAAFAGAAGGTTVQTAIYTGKGGQVAGLALSQTPKD